MTNVARKIGAVALGLSLAGLIMPPAAQATEPITAATTTPTEEREAAEREARAERVKAIETATQRATAYTAIGKRLVTSTTNALTAATTAYQTKPSLANFRILAQAKSANTQAKIVSSAISAAASSQLRSEKKAINMTFDATMRPVNLWFTFKNNGVATNPCFVEYMGHVESLTATLIDALETTAMTSATQWESSVVALRSGLVTPHAKAVKAEVELQKARTAYNNKKNADTLAALNFRKAEFNRLVIERNNETSRLQAVYASVKTNLPVATAAILDQAQQTYQAEVKPHSDALTACIKASYLVEL